VDVWSLGCTLYEMLTAKGSLANRANGVARMEKANYKHGEMPLGRALISRCLTADPALRWYLVSHTARMCSPAGKAWRN
jgi:serine/threonine protein kinase